MFEYRWLAMRGRSAIPFASSKAAASGKQFFRIANMRDLRMPTNSNVTRMIDHESEKVECRVVSVVHGTGRWTHVSTGTWKLTLFYCE